LPRLETLIGATALKSNLTQCLETGENGP
jgi:hypothetical protein